MRPLCPADLDSRQVSSLIQRMQHFQTSGLGTDTLGVRCREPLPHMQRVATGRVVDEAYLAHLDAARLEIAVGKAIQSLSPVTGWGPEP